MSDIVVHNFSSTVLNSLNDINILNTNEFLDSGTYSMLINVPYPSGYSNIFYKFLGEMRDLSNLIERTPILRKDESELPDGSGSRYTFERTGSEPDELPEPDGYTHFYGDLKRARTTTRVPVHILYIRVEPEPELPPEPEPQPEPEPEPEKPPEPEPQPEPEPEPEGDFYADYIR